MNKENPEQQEEDNMKPVYIAIIGAFIYLLITKIIEWIELW